MYQIFFGILSHYAYVYIFWGVHILNLEFMGTAFVGRLCVCVCMQLCALLLFCLCGSAVVDKILPDGLNGRVHVHSRVFDDSWTNLVNICESSGFRTIWFC